MRQILRIMVILIGIGPDQNSSARGPPHLQSGCECHSCPMQQSSVVRIGVPRQERLRAGSGGWPLNRIVRSADCGQAFGSTFPGRISFADVRSSKCRMGYEGPLRRLISLSGKTFA